MIAALTKSLRALADPSNDNLDELAADFADAFRLVSDCPQILLTSKQKHVLQSLDAMLANGAGEPPAAADVREAARRALATIHDS